MTVDRMYFSLLSKGYSVTCCRLQPVVDTVYTIQQVWKAAIQLELQVLASTDWI